MTKIFASLDELNRFAAEKFVEIGSDAIGRRGNFTVALAGGSTPKSLYRLLSGDEYKNQIDWSKVFFFFGDERNVAPENEESNFRMADENLFAPLQIGHENIFRWETERQDAQITAVNYEFTIRKFFDAAEINTANFDDFDLPRFDLILLGMGGDGHTASLFPFTEALNEKEKIVVANPVGKLNTTRLTFTFPLINNARNVMFLVKGADKAEVLRDVLEGEFAPEKYPSQAVKPENGELLWLVNADAAALLEN